MEDYFNRVFTHETNNYPPYNLVAVTEDEFKLEIDNDDDLVSRDRCEGLLQRGKLTVEGSKAHG